VSTRTDRIFAALGIGFVVLTLAGVVFGGDLYSGSLNDSAAKVAARIAKPATTANWVGGYLEMLGVGCFLAFAIWASVKLGAGLLGQLARAAATAYAAVIVANLGVIYGIGSSYGHGISIPVARAFDAVGKGVYVGSWFLTAFFLIAIGAHALDAARRKLGWSAIAGGVVTLAAVPSTNNFGQLSAFLLFFWVIGASVALVRRPTVSPGAAAVAQHA
jgi:hypothetical protein